MVWGCCGGAKYVLSFTCETIHNLYFAMLKALKQPEVPYFLAERMMDRSWDSMKERKTPLQVYTVLQVCNFFPTFQRKSSTSMLRDDFVNFGFHRMQQVCFRVWELPVR